jgi:hypothetical protein
MCPAPRAPSPGAAVLLLDNYTAHAIRKFKAACQEHGVIACYLPLQSSNQVQPLDLSVFGITKKFMAKANQMEVMNIRIVHVARFVNAFMAAKTATNIIKTFRNSCADFDLDEHTIRCRICPEKGRCLIGPMIERIPRPEGNGDENLIEEMTYLEKMRGIALGDESEQEDELE